MYFTIKIIFLGTSKITFHLKLLLLYNILIHQFYIYKNNIGCNDKNNNIYNKLHTFKTNTTQFYISLLF